MLSLQDMSASPTSDASTDADSETPRNSVDDLQGLLMRLQALHMDGSMLGGPLEEAEFNRWRESGAATPEDNELLRVVANAAVLLKLGLPDLRLGLLNIAYELKPPQSRPSDPRLVIAEFQKINGLMRHQIQIAHNAMYPHILNAISARMSQYQARNQPTSRVQNTGTARSPNVPNNASNSNWNLENFAWIENGVVHYMKSSDRIVHQDRVASNWERINQNGVMYLKKRTEGSLYRVIPIPRTPVSRTPQISPTTPAQNATGLGQFGICVVCHDRASTLILWPCGHCCLCAQCKETYRQMNYPNCPLCRKPITETTFITASQREQLLADPSGQTRVYDSRSKRIIMCNKLASQESTSDLADPVNQVRPCRCEGCPGCDGTPGDCRCTGRCRCADAY